MIFFEKFSFAAVNASAVLAGIFVAGVASASAAEPLIAEPLNKAAKNYVIDDDHGVPPVRFGKPYNNKNDIDENVPSQIDESGKSFKDVSIFPDNSLKGRRKYTVPQLVDIALQRNPLTRQAWLQAISAARLALVAHGADYPTLTLGGGPGGSYARKPNYPGGEQIWTQNIAPSISLNYLLWDAGGRKAAKDMALQQLFAADYTVNVQLQSVATQVLSSYFTYEYNCELGKIYAASLYRMHEINGYVERLKESADTMAIDGAAARNAKHERDAKFQEELDKFFGKNAQKASEHSDNEIANLFGIPNGGSPSRQFRTERAIELGNDAATFAKNDQLRTASGELSEKSHVASSSVVSDFYHFQLYEAKPIEASIEVSREMADGAKHIAEAQLASAIGIQGHSEISVVDWEEPPKKMFTKEAEQAMILQAFNQRPDLAVALAMERAAYSNYQIARSAMYPSLSLGISANNTVVTSQDHKSDPSGSSSVYQTGRTDAAVLGFTVNWTLFDGNALRNKAKAAAAAQLATHAAMDSALLLATAQVAGNFVAYRSAALLYDQSETLAFQAWESYTTSFQQFAEASGSTRFSALDFDFLFKNSDLTRNKGPSEEDDEAATTGNKDAKKRLLAIKHCLLQQDNELSSFFRIRYNPRLPPSIADVLWPADEYQPIRREVLATALTAFLNTVLLDDKPECVCEHLKAALEDKQPNDSKRKKTKRSFPSCSKETQPFGGKDKSREVEALRIRSLLYDFARDSEGPLLERDLLSSVFEKVKARIHQMSSGAEDSPLDGARDSILDKIINGSEPANDYQPYEYKDAESAIENEAWLLYRINDIIQPVVGKKELLIEPNLIADKRDENGREYDGDKLNKEALLLWSEAAFKPGDFKDAKQMLKGLADVKAGSPVKQIFKDLWTALGQKNQDNVTDENSTPKQKTDALYAALNQLIANGALYGAPDQTVHDKGFPLVKENREALDERFKDYIKPWNDADLQKEDVHSSRRFIEQLVNGEAAFIPGDIEHPDAMIGKLLHLGTLSGAEEQNFTYLQRELVGILPDILEEGFTLEQKEDVLYAALNELIAIGRPYDINVRERTGLALVKGNRRELKALFPNYIKSVDDRTRSLNPHFEEMRRKVVNARRLETLLVTSPIRRNEALLETLNSIINEDTKPIRARNELAKEFPGYIMPRDRGFSWGDLTWMNRWILEALFPELSHRGKYSGEGAFTQTASGAGANDPLADAKAKYSSLLTNQVGLDSARMTLANSKLGLFSAAYQLQAANGGFLPEIMQCKFPEPVDPALSKSSRSKLSAAKSSESHPKAGRVDKSDSKAKQVKNMP